MVDVSRETREETDARLRHVIRRARLKVLEGLYGFEEFPARSFPARVDPQALALVRDGDLWSQLIACRDDDRDVEAFGIFSFHFEEGLDNSGFVGWLASHLKDVFGSGVIVVCGMNRADGGVYDYWGCPASIKADVVEEVRRLSDGD